MNAPPRARALEVFAHLRVWDTEHNNGVLIYVQLADRTVEIVADRGLREHMSAVRVGGGLPAHGAAFSRAALSRPEPLRGSTPWVRCWRATIPAAAGTRAAGRQ